METMIGPAATDARELGRIEFVGCCSFRVVEYRALRCYEIVTGAACERCSDRIKVLGLRAHTPILVVRGAPAAT